MPSPARLVRDAGSNNLSHRPRDGEPAPRARAAHGDAELDRAHSLDAYPFELFFWEAGLVIATHLAIALLANLLLL